MPGTKSLRYECLECDWLEIVLPNDYRSDGRVCKKCGGHISPTGFNVTARQKTIRQLRMIADDLEKGCGGFNHLIGVDLGSGPDRTAYSPPIKN